MVTNFTGRRDVDCSSSSLTFDYGFSMNSAANESWRDDPDRPSRNSGILEEDSEKRRIQSMLNAGTLTFKEFAMREPLPMATINDAVLEFLRGRDDAVVFGAQAVNAYVGEPRLSQDIDLVSTRAIEFRTSSSTLDSSSEFQPSSIAPRPSAHAPWLRSFRQPKNRRENLCICPKEPEGNCRAPDSISHIVSPGPGR